MSFSHLHFLVAGDVMLDEYINGVAERLSPEAPVPVVRIESHHHALGGAGNVALNLAKLGAKVTLTGALGTDHAGTRLQNLLEQNRIHNATLCLDHPTTTKTRFIAGKHQLLRADREAFLRADLACSLQIRRLMEQHTFDAVLLSDYGKGFCSADLCQALMEEARRAGIPVLADPKGNVWEKYKGAFLVTPNLKEYEDVAGQKIKNEDDQVERHLWRVREQFGLQNLLVTRSEKGMSLLDDDKVTHIPSHALDVFDVTGAGDTVLAVLAAVFALHGNLREAAGIANLAAGYVVSKLGAYAISLDELNDIRSQQEKNMDELIWKK